MKIIIIGNDNNKEFNIAFKKIKVMAEYSKMLCCRTVASDRYTREFRPKGCMCAFLKQWHI